MSQAREPLWFCHECHAEMRPLMIPDPHCASCQGTFVEKIENGDDDPREFQSNGPALDFDPGSFPPGMDAFFSNLQDFLQGPSPERRQRTQSPTPGGSTNSGNGVRIEMRNSDGTRTRTFTFGGPNTLGGSRPDRIPTLNQFVERGPQADGERLPAPLLAQYLSALLRQGPVGMGGLAELFGAPSGDYVTNEADFNQLLQQMMENSNAYRPVPATEEIIEKLPREVLEEGSPLLQKDCAVCKEQFSLKVEDPDELVIVTLPCKHGFHQGCILPWLKSSGTCPVCRHALVPQPGQEPPTGSNTSEGSSSSSRQSQQPRPPRSPSSPGSDLYNHLFSMIGGGSRNRTNSDPGRNRPTRDRRRSDSPDLPGGWADQVD